MNKSPWTGSNIFNRRFIQDREWKKLKVNMTNKVNIQFLREQLDKALTDIEALKDKVRENGAH